MLETSLKGKVEKMINNEKITIRCIKCWEWNDLTGWHGKIAQQPEITVAAYGPMRAATKTIFLWKFLMRKEWWSYTHRGFLEVFSRFRGHQDHAIAPHVPLFTWMVDGCAVATRNNHPTVERPELEWKERAVGRSIADHSSPFPFIWRVQGERVCD